MRHRSHRITLTAILAGSFALTGLAATSAPSPEEVKAITKKVADWQIKTFEDQHLYRAISSSKKNELARAKKDSDLKIDPYVRSFGHKWHDLEWHNAALYAGMNEWRKVADDGAD